jgi:hypothetical protein
LCNIEEEIMADKKRAVVVEAAQRQNTIPNGGSQSTPARSAWGFGDLHPADWQALSQSSLGPTQYFDVPARVSDAEKRTANDQDGDGEAGGGFGANAPVDIFALRRALAPVLMRRRADGNGPLKIKGPGYIVQDESGKASVVYPGKASGVSVEVSDSGPFAFPPQQEQPGPGVFDVKPNGTVTVTLSGQPPKRTAPAQAAPVKPASPANSRRFDEYVSFMIPELEGGYENVPGDSGGPTNKGVTHGVYDEYRHSLGLPTRDVRSITDQEARDIYRHRFWDAVHADSLPPRLDYLVFDSAVQHYPPNTIMLLGRALGMGHDAPQHWTPELTERVKNIKDVDPVLRNFMAVRRQYYADCIKREPIKIKFKKGWDRRLAELDRKLGISEGQR